MALQEVAGIYYPEIPFFTHGISGSASLINITMDASGEKVAFFFHCPKAGTLDGVGFKLGTVTTGDTLKVSFQDPDLATAGAPPDGVADQYNTVVIAGTDDNKWIDVDSSPSLGILDSAGGAGGGTKRTVTKGQKLYCVIEFNSYVAGNLNIHTAGIPATRGFPTGSTFINQFAAAAWARVAAASGLALKYDDGTYAYIPGTWPAETMTSVNFNSGSATFDEAGIYFKFPFRCEVRAAWACVSSTAADLEIVLYEADGIVVKEAVTLDKDVYNVAGIASLVPFTSNHVLEADTFYRLSFRPGASNCTAFYSTFPTATVLNQISGGANCHWTQRVDGGVWTEQTEQRPYLGLLINRLDDAVGQTGGLLRHPGMSGGTNG